MPANDLALLTEAAHEAGRIAMRFWQRTPETWEKPEGAGPVTEADLAVDRMLAATLCGARPDYGWLSEETEDTAARLDAPRTFIIDPIDGTRAFIAGEEGFAHSLAIAEHGIITAAVVYCPALNRLYTATQDGPALLNGAPIRPSARQDVTGATVLSNAAALKPEYWPGGVPEVKRAFRTSLALRLCLVADGTFDAMITLRDAWEWDIAAGDLIARAAGAMVTDRRGAPIRYNPLPPLAGGVLAAPATLHQDLVDRLKPIP